MPFGSLSSRWTSASYSLVRLSQNKDTPYQQIINHKHKIERRSLNYLSLCVSIHYESTDTGQRVSDYRRTPFISLWGAQPRWSPGNMHEPHQVVACYSQIWGCGQEQRPTSTLEGVDAAHFGQMVPSSQVKWFPCWGIFVLYYAWQINCRFLSFLLLSLFLAIKDLFFFCMCMLF